MENLKIVVVSDTHGNEQKLRTLILENPDTNWLIHLGDGETEFFKIKQQFGDRINMFMVKGNCDLNLNNKLKTLQILKPNKYISILACHGHEFDVKFNLNSLIKTAQTLKMNIALFGHTHIRHKETVNSTILLNPGSLSFPRTGPPSFAIISITKNQFEAKIVDFKNNSVL